MGVKFNLREFEDENGKFQITEVDMELVHYYIACHYIGTEAYKMLHPTADIKTCRTNSSRILQKKNVRRYLNLKRDEIIKEQCIDATRVLEELASIGFAPKGDEDYTAQVKVKALELLGKYFNMWQPQKEEEKDKKVINIKILEEE